MSIGLRTRIVRTASGKQAVQVVSKTGERLTVHKHIGSFADEKEKLVLMEGARVYIATQNRQPDMFAAHAADQLIGQLAITRSQPLFAYQLFSSLYDQLGFSAYGDPLIKDLVVARLYRPGSKLAAIELLAESFDVHYSPRSVYRHVKKALGAGIQATYCQAMVNFARHSLGDELRLVFYDVTTLYFDSSLQTELKDFGFSKDHRPADTQVVIGLVVNPRGFPLYFDIFAGNSFEGHTFIPIVTKLRKLLNKPNLVVVADAAMLSRVNLKDLDEAGIQFVIGARLANLSIGQISAIAKKLDKQPDATMETHYHTADGNYRLIASYSQKRADKDSRTRQKAVDKARKIIGKPATATSRYRFVKKTDDDETAYELNQSLIDKAEQLEGIKGYVTNTKLSAALIMERYHDLWRIERAFRISKSDLLARPIYHKLDESVRVHICLVFAALAITKYLELETGMSHRSIVAICSKLLTHTLINKTTGESVAMDTELPTAQAELIEKLRAVVSQGDRA